MRSILLGAHDTDLRLALWDRLVEEGYHVELAADGEEVLGRALSTAPDLVLLDAGLPRLDGLDVCRALRCRGFERPVILLTDRVDVADRVLGLKLGADDLLVKPYDVTELVARVEACLRRGDLREPAEPPHRFGAVEVDLRGARVLRDGRPVAMSPREFQLLACLVEHAGTPLSRDQLLDHVWGHDAMPSPRTVDVHVAWLRGKLEKHPHRPTLIRTIHGLGYLFDAETP
jgi:DNA-binding response OmpR family regulator